jgi:hypothetical protein
MMRQLKLNIKRSYTPKQTLGEATLSIDGNIVFQFKTLELAWLNNERQISCIPEGTYNVKVRTSQKYKRHLHILDVPNRSYILIHPANFAGSKNPKTGKSDLLGCVAVGKTHNDLDNDGILDITHSISTMKILMGMIKDNDVITITISS